MKGLSYFDRVGEGQPHHLVGKKLHLRGFILPGVLQRSSFDSERLSPLGLN